LIALRSDGVVIGVCETDEYEVPLCSWLCLLTAINYLSSKVSFVLFEVLIVYSTTDDNLPAQATWAPFQTVVSGTSWLIIGHVMSQESQFHQSF
jgi:hypothetical protein